MLSYENGILTVDEAADKVRIGKGQWYYFCNLSGQTMLPLPYGDGTYSVEVYERTGTNIYRPIKHRRVSARNTGGYLLRRNLYVPYTPAWEEARKMVGDKTGLEAYKIIKNWTKKHIIYDYIKKVKVSKQGELPDPLSCWMNKRGLCQDIASLMVGMLRAVGVKSRLVIGYADRNYHAWAEAGIDGKMYRFDPCGQAESYVRERWY